MSISAKLRRALRSCIGGSGYLRTPEAGSVWSGSCPSSQSSGRGGLASASLDVELLGIVRCRHQDTHEQAPHGIEGGKSEVDERELEMMEHRKAVV
jgi:hypothetical protein